MNTSWLSISQLVLAIFALIQSFFLISQHRFPRSALKSLAYAVSLSVSLTLVFDSLMWQGIHVLFYFPAAYATLIGIVTWSWLGIVLFSLVEHPTQLHRKILWRLPFIGGLLGYALPLLYVIGLFSLVWIICFLVFWFQRAHFQIVFRNYFFTLILILIHVFFLQLGYLLPSQICYAFWIIFVHRILNLFLVKDQIYESLNKPNHEVRA